MKTAFLAITAASLLATSAVSAQTAPAAKPMAAPAAAKPAAAPVAAPVSAPAPVKPATMPVAPPPPPAPVYHAPPPVYRAPAPAPVETTESLIHKIISQHRATIASAEALESMTQDKMAKRIARSTRYRAQRDIVTLETWLRQNGK